MIISNGVWVPAQGGDWHHFTVTRYRYTSRSKDRIRVAYERCDREQRQLHNDVDTEVDRVAEHYLSPDAVEAWRKQRAKGWAGQVYIREGA